MKNKIYLLLFSLTILISCSKEDNSPSEGLTYAYFEKNLTADMDYNAIVAKFGEPTDDVGSGIHIYVYNLTDCTEMWIGFTDKILYAQHMNKNDQVIHTLIEN